MQIFPLGFIIGAMVALHEAVPVDHPTPLVRALAKRVDLLARTFRRIMFAQIPISATKSLTGHSLGAIGVQEAIFSLLMMKNGFIADTMGPICDEPGCLNEAGSGWSSDTGYRVTCFEHSAFGKK